MFDTAIISAISASATIGGAGLGWLVRLQRRVDGNQADNAVRFAETNGRIDVIASEQTSLKADLGEIKQDVKEILKRL